MIELEIRGLDEDREQIRAMAARLRDLTPVLEACAGDIRAFMAERFASRTGPDGAAWAPGEEPGDGDLDETGELQGSIYARASAHGIDWGATAAHAIFAQVGTRTAPARPFAPVVSIGGTWVPVEDGPAGELWTRITEWIRRYVMTGEIG